MNKKLLLFVSGAGVAITAGAAIVIGVPVGIYSNKYQERSNKIELELNKVSGIKLNFTERTAFKTFEQLEKELDDLTKKGNLADFLNYFSPVTTSPLSAKYIVVFDKIVADKAFQTFTIDYYIQSTGDSKDKSNIRAVEIKGFSQKGWFERAARDIQIKPYTELSGSHTPPSTVYTFDFVKESQNVVDESGMKALVEKYAAILASTDTNTANYFNREFENITFARNEDTGNWADINEDQDSVTISIKLKRKGDSSQEEIIKRTLKGTGWFASPKDQLKDIKFSEAVVNSSSNLIQNKTTFEVFDSIFANPNLLTQEKGILNAPLQLENKPSADIDSFGKANISYEIDFRNSKIFENKIVLRTNLIFKHENSLESKVMYPKDLEIIGFAQPSPIQITNYFSSKLFNKFNGFEKSKSKEISDESTIQTTDGDAQNVSERISDNTVTDANNQTSSSNENASATDVQHKYELRRLKKDSTIKSGATVTKAALEELINKTSNVTGSTDVNTLLNDITSHLDSLYSDHPLKNTLQSSMIFNNREFDFKQPDKFRNIIIGKTITNNFYAGMPSDYENAKKTRFAYKEANENYYAKPMWFMWDRANTIDFQTTYAYIKSLPRDERTPFIKMMFDTPSMRSEVLKRHITLTQYFNFYNNKFYPAYEVDEIAPNGVYARNGAEASENNKAFVWKNFQKEWLSKPNPSPVELLHWINNVMSHPNINGILNKFNYVALDLKLESLYPNKTNRAGLGFIPGLFNINNLVENINEWIDKKEAKYSSLAKMLQLQADLKAIPVFSNLKLLNETEKTVSIDLQFRIYRDGNILTETATVSIPLKVSDNEIEAFKPATESESTTSENQDNQDRDTNSNNAQSDQNTENTSRNERTTENQPANTVTTGGN